MAGSAEQEPIAQFIEELYELGGFASWGEFAREAGFLASTISDYKTGKNAPSGPNLLRLIQAATDRSPTALGEAAERTSPNAQVRNHLRELAEQAERGREAAIVSLQSIDTRLSRIERLLGLQDARGSEAQ